MKDYLQKNIPKGWKRLYLKEVAQVTNGKTNSQDAVSDGLYPLFDRSVFIKKSNKYLFNKTAIILPGEGAEFVPRYFSGKFDLHQRAYAIFDDDNKIYLPYLYQFLYANRHIFAQNAVGSTVKSLRLPIIQNIQINIPPISEQKKIAEILACVDEDIEKTDEIIKNTQKLKKGLTQDLLTKGIRNTKFKKSELGEIPENWEVKKIKNSGIKMIDGDRGLSYPKKSDFYEEGYCLFLSNKNIKNDKFIFDEKSFITKEKDEDLRKGKLQRKDVVLTTRGTVGNVAFYDNKIVFNHIRINSGMLIFRSDDDLVPEYLYKLFSSHFMKRRYKDMVSGSAQPQLPISSLENISIPVPSKVEQKKIAEILSAVDNKIDIYKQIKRKLTELKKGLMQDLLSGEVRVKI